jgi:DNA-binding transcriptional ArsR family regulator
VDAFLAASGGVDVEALLARFDPDVVLRADPAALLVQRPEETDRPRGDGCAMVSSSTVTCDFLVTYDGNVSVDDLVFKALADPTRRLLLDRLFERDGRTLTELESEVEMTRFGVMKHLRLLEDAGLVVTRRSGREKLHFLNPVPIRLLHDRWIDKYTERRVTALVDLETELEEGT